MGKNKRCEKETGKARTEMGVGGRDKFRPSGSLLRATPGGPKFKIKTHKCFIRLNRIILLQK